MATFTLQTYKNEDHSVTNAVVVPDNRVLVHTPAQANTLTLPAGAPVGFSFTIVNNAAFVVTIAAPSGETLTGPDTTVAATIGVNILVVKTASTVWTSSVSTT